MNPNDNGHPKILVTGGTGLLGSYLLRELVAHKKNVTAIHRNGFPLLLTEEERAAINWVKGDIMDVVFLEEILQGIDEVYHCAGRVSFSPRRVREMMKINVEGTANLVNAAINAGVRKLVHVSSVSALGRKRDGITVTENVKWEEQSNLSAYGESKHLAEMEVWRAISEGLEAVIINPSIILGFGNWDNGSSAMFKNAYNEFPWYSRGISGFVDAEDVARAMRLLMDSEINAERFIISAEDRPYREIFTAMAKAFGKKPPRLKVNRFLAGIVWRLEKIKSIITRKDPLLTKETAETAQIRVYFDHSKLKKFLPAFSFKPLEVSIAQHCREYLVKMKS